MKKVGIGGSFVADCMQNLWSDNWTAALQVCLVIISSYLMIHFENFGL